MGGSSLLGHIEEMEGLVDPVIQGSPFEVRRGKEGGRMAEGHATSLLT